MGWLYPLLIVLNQILSAGIVITAFSLLLYALTFNLRDRVARSFAALLAFVTIVYFCDAVVSTTQGPATVEVWLRLQWIGIAFTPVAYLHFSDALLATTGQPSRGRRRASIRILYGLGGLFLIAATRTQVLVRGGEVAAAPAPHLMAGPLFPVFGAYFIGAIGWAAWNFGRAYRRCQTPTTRRRMLYLMAAAAAPAIGAFPFLLLAGQAAALHPIIFWAIAVIANVVVTVLLVVMAYAVAYFGVSAPDRIVKGRLFQWILRGPIVASSVLTVYVLVNRFAPQLDGYGPRLLPIVLIGTLLLLQFVINLARLPLESALFYGADQAELRRLQVLGERLLSSGDLRQFLESVLAGLCDALHVSSAFIATFGPEGKVDYAVSVGPEALPETERELPPFTAQRPENSAEIELFPWGDYWVTPLRNATAPQPLGLLGVRSRLAPLTADDYAAMRVLIERATTALEDRRLQREVFQTLDRLLPQIEAIQRLRAATGYAGGAQAFTQTPAPESDTLINSPNLAQLVRQALTHYWGGPRLSESPLLQLRVVEAAMREHNGNPVNALRAVLAQAIERLRPAGQRKFTTEWVLYNIMEMKFLQNRRVREVALRLAVSEADLYRKQRLAIEQVARAIAVMEKEAAQNGAVLPSAPLSEPPIDTRPAA
jgi:hypothetical protein